jgi:hypothetical protein
MHKDIFADFNWHSSIGIDATLEGNKRFVTRIANTKMARDMFMDAGNDLLIHKTTRCLWKVSDDKKSIEPVFRHDILTEDDVKTAMTADQEP